jgi:hypothetical protein
MKNLEGCGSKREGTKENNKKYQRGVIVPTNI